MGEEILWARNKSYCCQKLVSCGSFFLWTGNDIKIYFLRVFAAKSENKLNKSRLKGIFWSFFWCFLVIFDVLDFPHEPTFDTLFRHPFQICPGPLSPGKRVQSDPIFQQKDRWIETTASDQVTKNKERKIEKRHSATLFNDGVFLEKP